MNLEVMNMMHRKSAHQAGRATAIGVAFAILAMWGTRNNGPVLAQQQSAQPTFPSAADASQSLFLAVARNSEQAIVEILGGPTELASSRDEAHDQLDRELFVQKFQEMHRLVREADGSVTLYIGAENWPFPVPLVANNGAWHFDPDAGLKEVLFRRVGENELTAIEICHQLVAGTKEFRAQPNTAGQADSALAKLASRWAGESPASNDPVMIYGYHFRVLAPPTKSGPAAGGIGFIAYPAEYRSSGVMTFVVSENGVVYEKDLGPDTTTLAAGMGAFHRDATWRAADE
jgi:hypothetical protein